MQWFGVVCSNLMVPQLTPFSRLWYGTTRFRTCDLPLPKRTLHHLMVRAYVMCCILSCRLQINILRYRDSYRLLSIRLTAQILGYHDLPERTETDRNGLKRIGTDRNGLSWIPQRTFWEWKRTNVHPKFINNVHRCNHKSNIFSGEIPRTHLMRRAYPLLCFPTSA